MQNLLWHDRSGQGDKLKGEKNKGFPRSGLIRLYFVPQRLFVTLAVSGSAGLTFQGNGRCGRN